MMSLVSRFSRALAGGVLSVLIAVSPALAASPDKTQPKTAVTAKSENTASNAKEKGSKGKASKDKSAKKKAEKAPKHKTAKGKPEKTSKDKSAKSKAEKTSKAKVAKPQKSKSKKEKKSSKDKGAQSIGAPNRGKLSGALRLRSSRALKVRDKAHPWGLPDLVKLLQRAAGKVAKHHRRSVILVGDLSSKKGGELTGHRSHQSGRDADVGFYVDNSKDKPVAMTRFVAFDGDGTSDDLKWAKFDDERNWAFVEALLTDKTTDVHYIFVSSALRTRLLAYAKSKKVDKDVLTKAAFALISPHDVDVHDDHFHVRIFCPESMKATCIEEAIPGSAKAADDDGGAKAKEEKASKKSPKASTEKPSVSRPAAAEEASAEAAHDVYSN